MEALFTSITGGAGLSARVCEVIEYAAALSDRHRVDVHIMTFSFTDEAIARLLLSTARIRPAMSIRIIADWAQGAEGSGRRVRELSEAALPNLIVRYKNDQPYVWDPHTDRIRWSYRASRGLLHHKTLAVIVDGAPRILVCGSFNWTGRSARSYENLLVLDDRDAPSVDVMNAVELEFAAMWCDGRTTLSPPEVRAHFDAILAEYRCDPGCPATDVVGIGRGEDVSPPVDGDIALRSRSEQLDGEVRAVIAFSSRSSCDSAASAGYAGPNRARRFELRKPSGQTKRVPVTLSNIALDMIARAQPDERLMVAMYGLSARVPEYGALLQAARRGVRLMVILDGHVGRPISFRLAAAAYEESLPIWLRAGHRMMHQKYVIHPEGQSVLTGTANMSTDSSGRHTEHRILFRGDTDLTSAFLADFNVMWERISSPFRTAADVT